MQIQLKQPEIEAAVEMYLESTGIVTKGKNVTLEFTMNRKPTRLLATVNIEGVHIPGFTDVDNSGIDEEVAAENRPALAVVAAPEAVIVGPEEKYATADATNAPEEPVKSITTSLFGGKGV